TDGKGALLGQLLGEVLPLEVLHDHVAHAAIHDADVQDTHHMIALDLRRRARLATKPLGAFVLDGDVIEEELDGDRLIELQVVSQNDDTHTAFAENLVDAVFVGEHFADGYWATGHGQT